EVGVGPTGDEHEPLLVGVGDDPGHRALSPSGGLWSLRGVGGASGEAAWRRSWRAWGAGDVVSSWAARASSAACAEDVPGRRRATHPSIVRCGALETASAPGGTSWRMTAPAPV